jgi:hypothetical protein
MSHERKKRPLSTSIYLGELEARNRRIDALNQLAQTFGVNRSRLIAMIADGELQIVRRS